MEELEDLVRRQLVLQLQELWVEQHPDRPLPQAPAYLDLKIDFQIVRRLAKDLASQLTMAMADGEDESSRP